MTLVLDSSVTLAWTYADEVTPAIEQVFERIADTQAWVPAIWPAEVANGLQSGVRRGRIDTAFRDAALTDLAVRAIVTDAGYPLRLDDIRFAVFGTGAAPESAIGVARPGALCRSQIAKD